VQLLHRLLQVLLLLLQFHHHPHPVVRALTSLAGQIVMEMVVSGMKPMMPKDVLTGLDVVMVVMVLLIRHVAIAVVVVHQLRLLHQVHHLLLLLLQPLHLLLLLHLPVLFLKSLKLLASSTKQRLFLKELITNLFISY
jgi:hypothetical protein